MPGLDFLREKHTIWDNSLPIVQHDNGNLEVYITDSINEPFEYNELCHRLRAAPASTTVTLHINTPGGIIDSALMIIDAMKASQATIVGCLTGTVASAGTIIALACDHLILGQHLTFMIHNYSGGMVGKGHEMKAHQEFVDRNLNEAFKSFYAGFLTPKEMQSIIDGRDLWLSSEEVAERWQRRLDLLTTSPKVVDAPTVSRRGRPRKA